MRPSLIIFSTELFLIRIPKKETKVIKRKGEDESVCSPGSRRIKICITSERLKRRENPVLKSNRDSVWFGTSQIWPWRNIGSQHIGCQNKFSNIISSHIIRIRRQKYNLIFKILLNIINRYISVLTKINKNRINRDIIYSHVIVLYSLNCYKNRIFFYDLGAHF